MSIPTVLEHVYNCWSGPWLSASGPRFFYGVGHMPGGDIYGSSKGSIGETFAYETIIKKAMANYGISETAARARFARQVRIDLPSVQGVDFSNPTRPRL